MDSRSRRLPFCLSSSRSSYTTSPSLSSTSSSIPSSSSSLGASRLYSPAPVLNNDRFPRASSTYKAELDQQNSRLLSSSRDYSSDSHSSSWKLPTSLTSSSRSYDRPWAESSLNSRSKLTDSEGRLGMCSGLLNPIDDGDSKRAKLSYNNRGLYSRTSSSSVTGSTYNSSSRGVGEKQSDTFDSSWSPCRLLPRSSLSSSNSLLSRREQETKNEPRLLNLGERRIRSPAAAPSLYQTDRVTSTYAQGARPKETTYSSLSSRESSLNRHLSSPSSSSSHRSSPLVHNLSGRTTTRPSNVASSLYSSQEQRGPDSSSYSSSHPPWYSSSSSPLPRPEASLPPRPAPEGEPEGRRSTRRLLSRLFSRRSSQDSSSGSSSVRSIDDDTPSTGGESVDSDEGARTASTEPEGSGPEMTMGGVRSRRADLAPIQENNGAYRSGVTRSRMASWREPAIGSDDANGGSGGSSWISSSLRSRCPPLLSRLRRHVRDESSHPVAGLEEGYNGPQRLLRRWDDLELKASQDDDDDDEDDDEEEENDEEEGAVGLDAFGSARRSCRLDGETLPELEDAATEFSPRRRAMVASYENMSVRLSGATENQDQNKTVSSRDQEKLRKIKERLLMEESDEEEGDLCRICQMGEESASNPLIQPCHCTGSLQFVHQECIKRWLRSKIGSGTNLEAITTCELCKEKLHLNIDNFDIQELYRTHVQSEYDEFISSGLYLVVLLHFCEQRFSDVLGAVDAAGLFNLVRILHEHMDSLQSSHGESDDDMRETRPSIEFSDLDDDLEEEY